MAIQEGVFIKDQIQWDLAFKSYTGPVGQYIMENVMKTVAIAKIEAPHPGKPTQHNRTGISAGTGNLSRNIIPMFGHSTDGDLEAKVVANVSYARMVHEPTRPHMIKAARGKRLVFYWPQAGGLVAFPKVKHPGTKGNDFLVRAMKKAWK